MSNPHVTVARYIAPGGLHRIALRDLRRRQMGLIRDISPAEARALAEVLIREADLADAHAAQIAANRAKWSQRR